MRDGERRHHPEDVPEGRCKPVGRLPATAHERQDRGKEQRNDEQDVINADPYVPDALAAEGKKLREQGGGAQFKSLRGAIGGKGGRMRLSFGMKAEQALVLRVEVEKQPVADLQRFGVHAAIRFESQHGVGAIAVVVDEVPGWRQRAGPGVGFESKPGKGVGGDVGVLGLQFAPGYFAIAIGVQADRDFQVAYGDIPLTDDASALDAESEVAVARLVGMRCLKRQESKDRKPSDSYLAL